MATKKYCDISSEPGINQMPSRDSAPATPPKEADAVYLYSDKQGRAANARGVLAPAFTSPEGSRLEFTEKIPFGRGFEQRLEAWQREHPDGQIMGYHTPKTAEFWPQPSDPTRLWQQRLMDPALRPK